MITFASSKTSYFPAHLHPGRLGRVQPRVERDRVLLVRRQGPAHVDDGHLQRRGHAEPAAGRARFRRGRAPADAQVGPPHVRVDERGQVAGVHAVLEVLAVHPGQIVVPLLCALRTARGSGWVLYGVLRGTRAFFFFQREIIKFGTVSCPLCPQYARTATASL